MTPERRLSFGEVAELYDRARPSYPPDLIDDVIAFSGTRDGDLAVEVGAGTGKATALFAQRGVAVLAIEPSREMAAVARLNLAGLSAVRVVESDFEHWVPGRVRAKLVYSAQAWHWLAPEVRYQRAREALLDRGTLAVFWNRARWTDTPLRDELARTYQRTAPELADDPGPLHPAAPASMAYLTDWDLDRARGAGFAAPERREYLWSTTYATEEYLALLGTLSEHRLLTTERREALLAAVADVIDRAGGIEVTYAALLVMAKLAGSGG